MTWCHVTPGTMPRYCARTLILLRETFFHGPSERNALLPDKKTIGIWKYTEHMHPRDGAAVKPTPSKRSITTVVNKSGAKSRWATKRFSKALREEFSSLDLVMRFFRCGPHIFANLGITSL